MYKRAAPRAVRGMGDPLGSSLCLGPKRTILLLDGRMGRYTATVEYGYCVWARKSFSFHLSHEQILKPIFTNIEGSQWILYSIWTIFRIYLVHDYVVILFRNSFRICVIEYLEGILFVNGSFLNSIFSNFDLNHSSGVVCLWIQKY